MIVSLATQKGAKSAEVTAMITSELVPGTAKCLQLSTQATVVVEAVATCSWEGRKLYPSLRSCSSWAYSGKFCCSRGGSIKAMKAAWICRTIGWWVRLKMVRWWVVEAEMT